MGLKIIVSISQIWSLEKIKSINICETFRKVPDSFISTREEFSIIIAIFLVFNYLYNTALKCMPNISPGAQLKKHHYVPMMEGKIVVSVLLKVVCWFLICDFQRDL